MSPSRQCAIASDPRGVRRQSKRRHASTFGIGFQGPNLLGHYWHVVATFGGLVNNSIFILIVLRSRKLLFIIRRYVVVVTCDKRRSRKWRFQSGKSSNKSILSLGLDEFLHALLAWTILSHRSTTLPLATGRSQFSHGPYLGYPPSPTEPTRQQKLESKLWRKRRP